MNSHGASHEQELKKIEIGPGIPELPEEARKDLSTDQLSGYNMVVAIRSGVLLDRFASLQIQVL